MSNFLTLDEARRLLWCAYIPEEETAQRDYEIMLAIISDGLKVSEIIEMKNGNNFRFTGRHGKMTARNVQLRVTYWAEKCHLMKQVTPTTLLKTHFVLVLSREFLEQKLPLIEK